MARTALLVVLALCATGCRNKLPDSGDTGQVIRETGNTTIDPDSADTGETSDTADTDSETDADGDGFAEDVDCDDTDPHVHPEADEICNGVDDDCDLLADDEDPDAVDATTWYGDLDGDGWGSPDNATSACTAPSLFVDNSGDCDDTDAEIHPDATEVCNGLDDDCDTVVDDEDDSVEGRNTWYLDDDGDGYGGTTDLAIACEAPEGFVANADDCDDSAATSYPGAGERCNGEDDDCDLEIDEGADDATSWFTDVDGDGYGDADSSVLSCDPGSGFVSDDTDCDDGDAEVNPGAAETCNGSDDDCDGLIDDDDPDLAEPHSWYADTDGDGYGDPDSESLSCTAPSGTVADDSDGAVNPGASEVCNGTDDDCDALVDDDDPDLSDASTWYLDSDGDGHGDATATTSACEAPSGYASTGDDCDDTSADALPGGTEVCDGLDNDCDGTTDQGATDAATWYDDSDGDGYGDGDATSTACEAPTGTVADASDCDDADGGVHPGADETCDGVDEDCDGSVDEDPTDGTGWYPDSDGDGYGDSTDEQIACEAPSGRISDGTDCDDTDSAIHPGETEVCNGVDDDCDGFVDDSDSSLDTSTGSTWYAGADGDGYGDPDTTTLARDEPSGFTSDDSDCEDASASIHPGATDTCDGVDNDCSGLPDDTGTCPCAVEHDGTHVDMFCTSSADWESGRDLCYTYGYHLATLGDSTENAWVDGMADTYSTGKWWIGLNDRDSEGTFVWENGESVTYTAWASGEPNNSGFHPDLTWNDEPCGSAFPYVCEADRLGTSPHEARIGEYRESPSEAAGPRRPGRW